MLGGKLEEQFATSFEESIYPLNDFEEKTMNISKINTKNIKSNANKDNYTDADSLVEYFHGMLLNYISLEKENNIVLDNETIQLEKVIKNYNKYADYEHCETHKNEDICKSNIDSSNMTDEKFTKKTNSEVTHDNSFLGIIKRYWYFIVIPVLIVGGVYYYKVYLLKKKESKE